MALALWCGPPRRASADDAPLVARDRPVPVIFDTDMHTDCDDVGTLAVLHALADLGEARILAVVHSAPAPWGPQCIGAINRYYDRPAIPVGSIAWPDYDVSPTYAHYRRAQAYVLENGIDYVQRVAERAPAPPGSVADAVTLYRRVLADAPDHSVVICATGMLYALARLLDSPPDYISAWPGHELVARKVRLLVTMGGGVFPEGADPFNWECDRPSAARVLNAWPTPLAVSHHGEQVLTGARLTTDTPEANPVRCAYEIYLRGPGRSRCSWDQLAMLYAVRGTAGLFTERRGHRLVYDPQTGHHTWQADPTSTHACVELSAEIPAARDAIEELMVRPPRQHQPDDCRAIFDIRQYGAVGDGATVNTAAIQQAIDDCTLRGGGEVLVAGGRFVTGTLYLKDHVTLHIASGAVLLGSTRLDDYASDTHKNMYAGESHMDRCLIFARGAEGIGLIGHGVIDGQGTVEHFPNQANPPRHRPMLIRFVDCSRLRVRDLSLCNPASWTSAWLYCRDIVVDGVTIHSRANWNGDGLDFDGCEDVRVSNCLFDTSDDSICLQASRVDRPCRRVVISNCTMHSQWAAVRIGLLSRGNLEDVTISNCVFRDIRDAGLKIQMCEGGMMKNMLFAGLVMRNVPRPVFLTFNAWRMGVDSPEGVPPLQALRDMQFRHLRIDNTELTGAPTGIVLSGVPGHLLENIAFDDVSMTVAGGGTAEQATVRELPEFVNQRPEFSVLGETMPFAAFYARHVRDLTLTNIRIDAVQPDMRPAIVCEQVAHCEVAGARLGAAFAGDSVIRLRRVEDVAVHDCTARGAAAVFVQVEQSAHGTVSVASDNRLGAAQAIQERGEDDP
ncbi:MAG: glycosyl hydrolase family 28 protein [Pirellulaceae bacterium]|nr:glycosyl hydrolase family 28 protein [Pirellulaceae bacterium]